MALNVRALLLGSAALWGGLAQTQQAAAQEVFALDPIRVESEGAQEALGNTSVTEEELEARNPTSLADIFAGESEIAVSGGAAIAQKVMVHGIEESLLGVTIDGARQNKSAFHHTGNVLIDPTLLKRVEISSGIAPADAGPGALAGLIAYETKDAADLLEPGATFGGHARFGYDSNGSTFTYGGTLYGMTGGFDYLLNATRAQGDDYRDGNGRTIGGTGADLTGVALKLGYTGSTGHRLEFSGEMVRDAGTRAMQGNPPTFGPPYFARPDFAGVNGRPTVYRAALSQRNSYTFTYEMTEPQGIWAPLAQLSYNEQLVEAGAAVGTNTSLSGKLENRFALWGGELAAGVDFFHDTARSHGVLNAPPGRETLNNAGIYAQMRQDVGERLSLSYGGRYDIQRYTLDDGSTHEAQGFSANAQADLRLTETLSLNAGVASSWGGFELSEASLINLNGTWTYGVPTASRALNARAGLRYEQGPWQAGLAYFHTRIDDVNDVLDPARPTSDVTSRGVDASVAYMGARGFARLNYTYADVREDGDTVASNAYYIGRPMGHIFALEAAYDVTPDWRVGGTAEIALANPDAAGAGAGPFVMGELPGYEVVNLYATYTPPRYDNVQIRFDVRNVFDAAYASRSSDGIGTAIIDPLNEPGRSFGLSLNVSF